MYSAEKYRRTGHAHFYLIDLKEEGFEFSEYKKLKQVEKIAKTSEQAHGMLLKVMEKMHERGKYMKERGIKNIVHTKEKDRYLRGGTRACKRITEGS